MSALASLSAHARSQLPKVGPRVYPYFKRHRGPELRRDHPEWNKNQVRDALGEEWADLRVYDADQVEAWAVRAHREARSTRKRARDEVLSQSLEDAVVGTHQVPSRGQTEEDQKHTRRDRKRCVGEVVSYIRSGHRVTYPVLVLAHTFPKPNLDVLEELSLAFLGQVLGMPRDVVEMIADFAGRLQLCQRYGFG